MIQSEFELNEKIKFDLNSIEFFFRFFNFGSKIFFFFSRFLNFGSKIDELFEPNLINLFRAELFKPNSIKSQIN